MSEIPKKRQARFDDLAKALSSGDEDMYSDLMRNSDPMAQKNDLSTMLGQHVRENYDSPLNAFENKKLLENVPVGYEKMPEGVAGKFVRNKGGIYLPHEDIEMPNRQMGTRLHELGHADEYLNKGFQSTPVDMRNILKQTGADAAEQAFGKHHMRGFFEKEALQKLLTGNKLSALLHGLGAAGLGAAAYGIGDKAMAGDLPGAATDTADIASDFIPGVANAKMALSSPEAGAGSDVVPEMPSEEAEKNRRFKKIREAMGVQ